MNGKKTFVLYQSSQKIIEKLSNEQAGILLKNIFRYNAGEELYEMDSATDIAFTCIQDYLDKDNEKYKAICERNIANGKKGGRPKKADGFLENPKNPDGFLENPKNLESESESDSDIEYESEYIKRTHGEYKNVLLTDDELEQLKTDFPDYQQKIDYLSSYMVEKGKNYRNHFAVIKRWDREDKAKLPVKNRFNTAVQSGTDYAGMEEQLMRN